jgi:Zn-dependent protease/CBS domain-containing protein
MSWAWKLASVAGIEIRIHATFLLLLLWIGGISYSRDHSAAAAGLAIAFILAVFATVALHELGHAFTARRFGVRTLGITLLPIGGVAQLDRIPTRPKEELLVALAGPAVNLLLALALFGVLTFLVAPLDLRDPIPTFGAFLWRLALVNVGLAVFNLLPAFPMDGGRALRALLATRMDRVSATRLAAHLGQGMAFLFAIAGLFGNPFLVFIGLFVWISAGEEAQATRLHALLDGVPVSEVMVTSFHTLTPETSLGTARDLLFHTFQRHFPVGRDGDCLGLLTHQRLVGALPHTPDSVPVTTAMETRFGSTTPGEPLAAALGRLSEAPGRMLVVLDGARVVGLLTAENVGEMFLTREGPPGPR